MDETPRAFEANESDESDVPERHVGERVAAGRVRRWRPSPDGPSSSGRRGLVLVIGLLIGAGSFVLARGLGSGNPGDSAEPSASAPVAVASPGPATQSSAPGDGRGFDATVVQTGSCLEEFDYPAAQVHFDVTWDGEVSLSLIEFALDGEAHTWKGGPGGVDMSGSLKHTEFVPVGEPHVMTISFYEGTDPDHPGPPVGVVSTTIDVNPTNSCYPDEPDPTPTEKPPLLPAQIGDVIAIVPPGEGDDRIQARVEVVGQCRSDVDTAMVTFRISWQSTEPVDRVHGDIGSSYDSYRHENELGADGRLGSAGAYERTVNVRVGRDLWMLLGFWMEVLPDLPDEQSNGIYMAEAYGPALFEPQNPCP